MSQFYQQDPQLITRDEGVNVSVAPVCPYCGREIMRDALYCPYCSAKLGAPEQQNNPYQQNYNGQPAMGQQYQQGYGEPQYSQENMGQPYGGQQYGQSAGQQYGQPYPPPYAPQPHKVDLTKQQQRPYYQPEYPNVQTVNEPYVYSAQNDGFFTPQSFDGSNAPYQQMPYQTGIQQNAPAGKKRNKWIYFVLTLVLGFFGAHNFYENKPIKGALWYLPFIPFVIGVASEIANVNITDVWAGILAVMWIVNGARYLIDLVRAIIRLISTQGDEYTLDK